MRLRLFVLDTCLLELRTGEDPEPESEAGEETPDPPDHKRPLKLGFNSEPDDQDVTGES